MKKTVLKYGGYGAITICTLFLLAWFLGDGLSYSLQEIIGYVSMVVSLSFVYFGIRHYRDIENSGTLTFGKGLLIGISITLITALAFGILDVIFVKFINPDFMTEYYDHSLQELETNFSGEELAVKKALLEEEKEVFSNPWFSFGLMFLSVFMIGFIISLISALFLQKKPHQL